MKSVADGNHIFRHDVTIVLRHFAGAQPLQQTVPGLREGWQ